MGHNYAGGDINKSRNEKEMEGERQWTQPLEGDAWNIATYELVSNL